MLEAEVAEIKALLRELEALKPKKAPRAPPAPATTMPWRENATPYEVRAMTYSDNVLILF